jgi:hypothetical protein
METSCCQNQHALRKKEDFKDKNTKGEFCLHRTGLLFSEIKIGIGFHQA